jgi:hypothetical protein
MECCRQTSIYNKLFLSWTLLSPTWRSDYSSDVKIWLSLCQRFESTCGTWRPIFQMTSYKLESRVAAGVECKEPSLLKSVKLSMCLFLSPVSRIAEKLLIALDKQRNKNVHYQITMVFPSCTLLYRLILILTVT